MNNISFRANLELDSSLYEKLPKGTPSDFPDQMISEFREFLDIPNIKAATDGDTIELKSPEHRGYTYALEATFSSESLKETIIQSIYLNEKIPNINPNKLKMWTLAFLCYKKGEKPIGGERERDMIERVLFNGEKIFNRDYKKSPNPNKTDMPTPQIDSFA